MTARTTTDHSILPELALKLGTVSRCVLRSSDGQVLCAATNQETSAH